MRRANPGCLPNSVRVQLPHYPEFWRDTMIRRFRLIAVIGLMASATLVCAQTGKKAGVLTVQELKKLAPTSFYFDGQAAPVQLRNAAAFRSESGKMVLAGLVDNSGYASDIQQKYQGFFI